MSKLGKKLLAAGVCLSLALGTLTGCGSNAGKAIATLDGESVDYSLVNLMVRFNQAHMQTSYGAMLGANMWESYGDTTKTGVVESIEEMMILEKHMDEYDVSISDEEKEGITEAAKSFMDSNEEKILKSLTASQEIVERMLTLSLIQTKMRGQIIKDVDTEVSDEEAAQKTIQYVLFSTAGTTDADGKSVAMTDEDKAKLKEQAQEVLDAVKSGTDMDEAAKAVDDTKSSSSTSYGKDSGTIDAAVKEAVDSLSDGETADSVIEGETGYYVAKMTSTFDETATETQKATIVSGRQDEKYKEVYEAWKKEVTFTVDEALLAKINFADMYEVKVTEAATEAASTSTTEAATEAVSGTEEVGSEAESASETAAQ